MSLNRKWRQWNLCGPFLVVSYYVIHYSSALLCVTMGLIGKDLPGSHLPRWGNNTKTNTKTFKQGTHTHTNAKNTLWRIQIAKCSDNRTNWERSSRFPPPLVKQFPSFQDSKLHANFWLLVVLQFVWNYMKICSPFEMVKRGWHQFIFHWHFYNNKLCLKWRWLARDCIIKGGYLYKKRFFFYFGIAQSNRFCPPQPNPSLILAPLGTSLPHTILASIFALWR